jgi:hypothetical protein
MRKIVLTAMNGGYIDLFLDQRLDSWLSRISIDDVLRQKRN